MEERALAVPKWPSCTFPVSPCENKIITGADGLFTEKDSLQIITLYNAVCCFYCGGPEPVEV